MVIYLLNQTLLFTLQACAYNPVIDTAGRSGTFNNDMAREITNDVQHCQKLADKNKLYSVKGIINKKENIINMNP